MNKEIITRIIIGSLGAVGGGVLTATFLIFTAGNAEAATHDTATPSDSAVVVSAPVVVDDSDDVLVTPLVIQPVEILEGSNTEGDSTDSAAGSVVVDGGSEGGVSETATEKVHQEDPKPKGVGTWFAGVWDTVWGKSEVDKPNNEG